MRKGGTFLPHPPRGAARGLSRAIVAGALAAGAGCAATGNEGALIKEIDPATAYNDATVRIALIGSSLRPPLDIDTHSGAASTGEAPFDITLEPIAPVADRHAVAAIDVEWISAGEIHAGLPAGVLPGAYRVDITNARGQAIESRAVFASLGPDNDPPVITFLRPAPGTTVSPNTGVLVEALVDDGPGHSLTGHWTASSPTLGTISGECTIDPGDRLCRFYVPAPSGPSITEPILIEVDVQDGVGHSVSATLQIQVALGPDIQRVSPTGGPTIGGTLITVQGTGFVPGLSRILIDGRPLGGVVDGDNITATTQPHTPGSGKVSVANGDSESADPQLLFNFVPPPTLRLVSPTSGPAGSVTEIVAAGNDFTPNTRFFVVQDDVVIPIADVEPNEPLPAPPYAIFDTDHRYVLTLGPGMGTITLRAHDDVGGDTDLPAAFTYDPPSP